LARLSAQEERWSEVQEAAVRAVTLAQRLGARHLESLARCWLAVALRHGVSKFATTQPELGNSPPGVERPPADALNMARQEAEMALELAADTELNEAWWRGHDTLAALALEGAIPDAAAAEGHLRAALAALATLRVGLIEAGLPDTLLENADCAAVYERLTRLLYRTGRSAEAVAVLEQAAWPPLTERLTREFGAAASES
jgi:hypothetical protein